MTRPDADDWPGWRSGVRLTVADPDGSRVWWLTPDGWAEAGTAEPFDLGEPRHYGPPDLAAVGRYMATRLDGLTVTVPLGTLPPGALGCPGIDGPVSEPATMAACPTPPTPPALGASSASSDQPGPAHPTAQAGAGG
jgi:hypothetical protein